MPDVPPEEPVSPEAPHRHPHRPRRRWLRRALVASLVSLLVLVLCIAIVIVSLPRILTEQRVKEEMVSALTGALNTPIEIGEVHYDLLSGIEIIHLRIGPPKGFTRDVFTADRIALHYDLSKIASRQVTVREISIDRPALTIETRGDATNLDAFRSNTPPKQSGPLRGPISPIRVVLQKAAIVDLRIELAGDGPRATLEGLSLDAHGQIDPKRLDAVLALAVTQPAAKREHAARAAIQLVLPARVPAGPELSASVDLSLTSSVALAADARDGIAVEDLRFGIRSRASSRAEQGGRKLPLADVAFQMALEVRPKEDRAELGRVLVTLGSSTLLSGGIRIDGLHALLEDEIGAPAARALAAEMGLFKRFPEGIVRVSVAELALPLTEVAPLVKALRPELDVAGRVALVPIEVEGRVPELVGGRPRRLAIGLVLEDLSVRAGSIPLAVGHAGGRVDLGRAEGTSRTATSGASLFFARGRVDAQHISAQGNRIDRAELDVDLGMERLGYPIAGPLHARVGATIHGLAAPTAHAGRVSASVEMHGIDVLDPDRAKLAPIAVRATLSADQIQARTGTTSIDVAGLDADLRVTVDRLLPYAEKPIDAQLEVTIRQIDAGGARRTSAGDVHLSAAVEASDPRSGRAIDADARLTLALGRAATEEAALKGARLTLATSLKGVQPRTLGHGPPVWLPGSALFNFGATLPEIALHLPQLGGEARAKAELSIHGNANLAAGTIGLKSLVFALNDAITLRASGRAKEVLSATPWIDARLQVAPIDLERAIAMAPPGALSSLPGLRASGKIGLSAHATGYLPQAVARTDLEHPPLEASGELVVKEVSASLPSREISLEGFDGAIAFDLSKAGSELRTSWKLARAARTGKSPAEARDVSMDLRAGLKDHVWQVLGGLKAARLVSGTGGRQAVEGAHIDLDATYPKRGDLELRRLEVKIPGSGVDVTAQGRLARRRFGAFRPEVELKASLDLDQLRALVPEIGDAHGKVQLDLEVATRLETVLDAHGALALDGFSFERPGLVVRNASGRIPVDQRVVIPAPTVREDVAAAEGMLGEDLEARIAELQQDLDAFKLYLDADDILARPPRTADYEALRPYYRRAGAHLTIDELELSGQPLRAISFEGLWRSGVFRIDRFAASLWEGDVIGDIAIQLTADQNVRTRARLTMTDLNFDIPYALAAHQPPVADPEKKKDYQVSGTVDVKFGFRERSVNGRIDLVKLSKPSVERFFRLLYKDAPKNAPNPAISALESSEKIGVRPVAGSISIVQNLLYISFEWERLWVHVGFPFLNERLAEPFGFSSLWKVPLALAFDLASIGVRPALLIPVFGTYVIDTVNNSNQGSLSVGNLLFDSLTPWIALVFDHLSGKMIVMDGSSEPQAGPP